jgi:hypothetical protein
LPSKNIIFSKVVLQTWGEIKNFQEKDKLKQFMSTKYALQRIFKSSKTHGRE